LLSYTDTFLTIYFKQEYITLLYIQKGIKPGNKYDNRWFEGRNSILI